MGKNSERMLPDETLIADDKSAKPNMIALAAECAAMVVCTFHMHSVPQPIKLLTYDLCPVIFPVQTSKCSE